MNAVEITKCRSCGSSRITPVLDFGDVPISDFVTDPTAIPDSAPLTVAYCEHCSLAQLLHTADRDRLYKRYWYRSGTNEAMIAALKDVAGDAMSQVALEPDDSILETGCNDGTLLAMFPGYVTKVGFDPAENLTEDALRRMDLFVNDYFPPTKCRVAVHPKKVILSVAMFYDLPDPNQFCAAVKDWLAPDGVWIIQLAYLPATIRTNNFGDVVHEHLEYYTVHSLNHLLARHGFKIAKVSFNDVNGGSVRLSVRHADWGGPAAVLPHDIVTKRDLQFFGAHVEALKHDTLRLLRQLRASGRLVVGYGASTKGSTMLAHYGIGPDLLPCIADRQPAKWGTYTAVSGIPVVSEEDARAMKPDYFFVLPWHFLDAFLARESAFVARGGRFIVPLPRLRVVPEITANDRPAAIREAA